MGWGADSEFVAYSYICEQSQDPAWSVGTDDGHAYGLFNEAVPWEFAKKRCEELGAHLATVTSVEEDLLLAEVLHSVNPSWIGGFPSTQGEAFAWVTKEAVSYSRLGAGTSVAEGLCMSVSAGGTWRGEACGLSQRYICELD